MSNMYMRFCPRCGRPLESRMVEGRPRPCCPPKMGGCGFVDFGRYTHRCQGLVLETESGERRVLLVRFEDGLWHFPGGHVDCEETAEVSVVREVKEEVGLDCAILGLVAFRNRVRPDVNESTAVFLLERIGGELRPDPAEVTEMGFFAAEQVRKLQLFPMPREVALAALGNTLLVLPPTIVGERDLEPVTIFVGK